MFLFLLEVQKLLPFSNSNPEGHHESASENGYVYDDYQGEEKNDMFSTNSNRIPKGGWWFP